jgi:hypothetical protein
MLQWLMNLFRPPRPSGPPRLIKRFAGTESIINREAVVQSEGGWLIDVGESQTIRLFEIELAEIDNCMLAYRANMKSEDLSDRGYLEMWCRIPGQGEFFSKGFHNALKGTNDWASYEVPFYLKRGQRPDLVKLNLRLEGRGKLWIKDIELSYTPLQ